MVCEYFNQRYSCRFHVDDDGSIDESYVCRYCKNNFSECKKYKENELLKKEIVRINGEEKGLALLANTLHSEAVIKDRLDGLV